MVTKKELLNLLAEFVIRYRSEKNDMMTVEQRNLVNRALKAFEKAERM